MGKGEIACYEQFLLFPQCFQKVCFTSKGVIVWEWVKQRKKSIYLAYEITLERNQQLEHTFRYITLNSLPKDEVLELSKLKAFADDKIDVTQKLKFGLQRIENIVGKGENAFSPFPSMFSKDPFLRVVLSHYCVLKS